MIGALVAAPHQGAPAAGAPAPEPQEVECPICYQEYDRYARCPRMLECLHVFCAACLQRIQPCAAARGPPTIPCPLCRHLTPLLGGDPLCLPLNLRILARLPPAAACRLQAAAPRLQAAAAQRLVLAMETGDMADHHHHHHHHFIILPTVSLRVQQLHPGSGGWAGGAQPGARGLRAEEVGVEMVRQHKRRLVCVQVLAVAFWVLFVVTCVVGVVFGPHLFNK